MKDVRDRHAVAGELAVHPVRQLPEVGLRIVAAGDARLVGDDDDEVAEFLRPTAAGVHGHEHVVPAASRQIGKSWTLAFIASYKALEKNNGLSLCISTGGRAA